MKEDQLKRQFRTYLLFTVASFLLLGCGGSGSASSVVIPGSYSGQLTDDLNATDSTISFIVQNDGSINGTGTYTPRSGSTLQQSVIVSGSVSSGNQVILHIFTLNLTSLQSYELVAEQTSNGFDAFFVSGSPLTSQLLRAIRR